jgi:hypothetical protein
MVLKRDVAIESVSNPMGGGGGCTRESNAYVYLLTCLSACMLMLNMLVRMPTGLNDFLPDMGPWGRVGGGGRVTRKRWGLLMGETPDLKSHDIFKAVTIIFRDVRYICT